MKHASEMTRAEILRDAFGVRRDKMQAAGTSDRVSAIAIGAQAECTRLEIRIHQLKDHQARTDALLKRLGIDASDEATEWWKVENGSGWTSHEKTWAANDAHAHISRWNEDSTPKLEMEIGGECWIDQEECSSVEDAMRRASFEAKEAR